MDPPPQPLILQQSYIFPTAIRTMTVTITERGITHKNLLMGLQSGYIVSVGKNFLDPRRAFNPTQEDREEGLYPYMPELSLNPMTFINYNQTGLLNYFIMNKYIFKVFYQSRMGSYWLFQFFLFFFFFCFFFF